MNRDASMDVDRAPVGVSTGTFASRALTVLILLTAALSVIACVVGLFKSGGTGPVSVTSVRGEDVELYGVGPLPLRHRLHGSRQSRHRYRHALTQMRQHRRPSPKSPSNGQ
jgi:hypothetical protein